MSEYEACHACGGHPSHNSADDCEIDRLNDELDRANRQITRLRAEVERWQKLHSDEAEAAADAISEAFRLERFARSVYDVRGQGCICQTCVDVMAKECGLSDLLAARGGD